MKLSRVTFTGVDNCTDTEEISRLSTEFPFIEWGILIGSGFKTNKFPMYVKEVLAAIPAHCNVAIHLCGNAVNKALYMEPELCNLLDDTNRFASSRVQLNYNHSAGKVNPMQVQWFIKKMYPKPIIVQVNANNRNLPKILGENNHYLFDYSGGTGKPMQELHSPVVSSNKLADSMMFGYAGGIGEDNLFESLGKIASVTPDNYRTWIDMESSLRDDEDYFDLDKCEAIASTIAGTSFIVIEPYNDI